MREAYIHGRADRFAVAAAELIGVYAQTPAGLSDDGTRIRTRVPGHTGARDGIPATGFIDTCCGAGP